MITTPEGTSQTLIGFSVALIISSTSVVALRLLARRLSAASFWWDDGFIVASLLLSYASYAILYIDRYNGMGVHQQEVTQDQLIQQLKNVYASEIFYPLNITTIKTSILLLYLRLFGARKRFRTIALLTLATVTSWCLSTILPAAFRCIPIQESWSLTPSSSQCFNIRNYLIATGIINVVLDFWILLLPLPMIWTLNLSTDRKAALSGIFMLGAFTCGASIVRAYTVATFNIDDITWSSTAPTIWSNVEISVGIICACLPILRPLVLAITGKPIFKSIAHSGRQYEGRRAGASGSGSRNWPSRSQNTDVERSQGKSAAGSDGDLASPSMELPLLSPAMPAMPQKVALVATNEEGAEVR